MDFDRIVIPSNDQEMSFDKHQSQLQSNLEKLYGFVQENYNLTTLSLETNYANITEATEKRLQYVDYLKRDLTRYFSRTVKLIDDEANSKEIIILFNQFDYLFQLHDSTRDLFETKRFLDQHYVELKSDTLSIVRAIAGDTIELFNAISIETFKAEEKNSNRVAMELQHRIDQSNRALLPLLTDASRTDAGGLVNFITYSQRIKDKLINFSHRMKSDDRGNA
jgi:phosphate:Na+ symporter